MSAAYFSPDVADFLRLLARHGVHYLVVSGEAVIHYGCARLTGDLDAYYQIDGVAFAECWENRLEARVAATSGEVPVLFIGLAELIRNKAAAGRDKDRDDLRYLRRVRG